jgi:hypothetical protein
VQRITGTAGTAGFRRNVVSRSRPVTFPETSASSTIRSGVMERIAPDR